MVALRRPERAMTARWAPARTRRRSGRRAPWIFAGLAFYGAGTLALLLSPVSPHELVAATTAWLQEDLGLAGVRQGWVEVAANIALFIPLGVLVALGSGRAWLGVVLAVALSAGAEMAQSALPGRTASLRDVVANVAGAAAGAVLVAALGWMRAHEKSMRTGREDARRWYGSGRGVRRTTPSCGAPRHE